MYKCVICHEIGGKSEPAWFETETNKPSCVFVDETQAAIVLIENHIAELECYKEEIKIGARSYDEVDYEPSEYLVRCWESEDGTLTDEAGEVIYDPKTYVR